MSDLTHGMATATMRRQAGKVGWLGRAIALDIESIYHLLAELYLVGPVHGRIDHQITVVREAAMAVESACADAESILVDQATQQESASAVPLPASFGAHSSALA